MNILFVGFSLSPDLFAEILADDGRLPVQTQRFGWSVIDSLHTASCTVRLVSAAPTLDYPHNKKLYIPRRSFSYQGCEGIAIPFVNLPAAKHVTRYISSRHAMFSSTRHTVEPDIVVVHGLHSPFLWNAKSLAKSLRVPSVAILTDPPSTLTAYDTRLTSYLKRVDRRSILACLRNMDGVITVSRLLADELAPGKPKLWMEGIASSSTASPPRPDERRGRARVVYAGGIHESYGVLDLAKSTLHSESDWEVHIYGKGPDEGLLQKFAEHSSRVYFEGAVPPDGMADVYANADVLVNPRDPRRPFARYSFPSKLIEYMTTGVPVITTQLPNLPDDYREYLTLTDSGPVGLARTIDDLLAMPPGERLAKAIKAQKFIMGTRGPAARGKQLLDFFKALRRNYPDRP